MNRINSQEDIRRSLQNHLETWAKENLPEFDELSEETSTEKLEEVFKSLERLAETEFEGITQEATGEFIDAIEATFREWAKTAREELDPESAAHQPIYRTMLQFFDAEEWPYVEEGDESILYLTFQGENGQWPCVATAREDEEQCVFYSLYPSSVAEEKRTLMAEFIAHANYGMIIGNFELDFSDGEIRYKTSIDVEGDSLTPALVKNLVYTNVMTMDKYFPGILAVLEEEVTPQDAIQRVEQDDVHLSDASESPSEPDSSHSD